MEAPQRPTHRPGPLCTPPGLTLTRSIASWAWAMRVLGGGFRSDTSWVEPKYLAPNMTPSRRSSWSQGPGTGGNSGERVGPQESRAAGPWGSAQARFPCGLQADFCPGHHTVTKLPRQSDTWGWLSPHRPSPPVVEGSLAAPPGPPQATPARSLCRPRPAARSKARQHSDTCPGPCDGPRPDGLLFPTPATLWNLDLAPVWNLPTMPGPTLPAAPDPQSAQVG